MAMIEGFLSAFGAAVAGFFGHLLAHDFAEIAPKLSKSLVQKAAHSLENADRERYMEEWLADLNERTGVLAKLKHACGCIVCARRMRKQSLKQQARDIVLRFEVCGIGSIDLDPATSFYARDVIAYSLKSRKTAWMRNRIGATLFFATRVFQNRRYGRPDFDKALKFIRMVEKSTKSMPRPRYKAWVNGVPVEAPRKETA
jgi:hypothetical protein